MDACLFRGTPHASACNVTLRHSPFPIRFPPPRLMLFRKPGAMSGRGRRCEGFPKQLVTREDQRLAGLIGEERIGHTPYENPGSKYARE